MAASYSEANGRARKVRLLEIAVDSPMHHFFHDRRDAPVLLKSSTLLRRGTAGLIECHSWADGYEKETQIEKRLYAVRSRTKTRSTNGPILFLKTKSLLHDDVLFVPPEVVVERPRKKRER